MLRKLYCRDTLLVSYLIELSSCEFFRQTIHLEATLLDELDKFEVNIIIILFQYCCLTLRFICKNCTLAVSQLAMAIDHHTP